MDLALFFSDSSTYILQFHLVPVERKAFGFGSTGHLKKAPGKKVNTPTQIYPKRLNQTVKQHMKWQWREREREGEREHVVQVNQLIHTGGPHHSENCKYRGTHISINWVSPNITAYAVSKFGLHPPTFPLYHHMPPTGSILLISICKCCTHLGLFK